MIAESKGRVSKRRQTGRGNEVSALLYNGMRHSNACKFEKSKLAKLDVITIVITWLTKQKLSTQVNLNPSVKGNLPRALVWLVITLIVR